MKAAKTDVITKGATTIASADAEVSSPCNAPCRSGVTRADISACSAGGITPASAASGVKIRIALPHVTVAISPKVVMEQTKPISR